MFSGAMFTSQPQTEKQSFKYALLDITQAQIEENKVNEERKTAQKTAWPAVGNSELIGVSVGDTVSVTIYESQAGGLFIPSEAGVRPGNFVDIPDQLVDKQGVINVPFAGEIKVVGRTPTDIANEIVEKLGSRAIEPQAIVSIRERQGAEVSVVGDVNTAAKFVLSLSGEKILDAIARAEGPRNPGYETYVTLQRGAQEWTVPFEDIVNDSSKNIYLKPRDTLYLYRQAQSFQIYGASGSNGSYDFRKRDISLSEAIGEARGLNDFQADPEEIYVYRQNEKRYYKPEAGQAATDASVPVIYRLNLREPDGFHLAQQFPVKDKDIVYIANAQSVEFQKFLDLLNPSSVTKINTQDAVQQ